VTRASLLLLFGFLALSAAPRQTALDRFVAKPDPAFKYELVNTKMIGDTTVHLIDMTSGTWRTAAEVDRTEWKHWVTIVIPAGVKYDTAFLMIAGGSNGRPAPERPSNEVMILAKSSKSIIAEVRMIPNEPLKFAGEDKTRTEDAIIAYTWDKFLKTGDETWPLRLPMTRASVKAMDVVQEFLAGEKGGNIKVNKFVVAGGSKRGWTAWTTAAVDKRVAAVIPIVIDTLNLSKQTELHQANYGFNIPAIQDYTDIGLQERANDPRMKELLQIEDPYSYRERFTMPKFLVHGTGDQYWPPDAWRLYYNDLPGEKNVRYVPNADHGLGGSDAIESIAAWYTMILENKPRPKLTWTVSKAGVLQVKTTGTPINAKLWQATNPEGRDFRLVKIGRAWTSTDLTAVKAGVYEVKLTAPPKGYTASVVELTFDSGTGGKIKLTTATEVTPVGLPFSGRKGPGPAAF